MKKTHVVALVLIAALIGFIVSTTSNYSTYETFTTAVSDNGREFKVVGELVDQDQMIYNPENDPNYFAFYMTDMDLQKRKVVYHAPKPQDFERSEKW